MEGARLLKLFFPMRLRLKREQKDAEEDAKRTFSKSFFAAQLRWYDIPCPSKAVLGELKVLLQDAVVAGKVSSNFHPHLPFFFRLLTARKRIV